MSTIDEERYQDIRRMLGSRVPRRHLIEEVRPSAEAGDANGQFLMGMLAPRPSTRKRWLLQAAAQDHPEACYELYILDLPDRTWLRRSADLGWPEAQCAEGCHHATLTPPDYTRSRQWYLRAAQNGNGTAMAEFGFMLLEGRGGPADPGAGLEWLEKAAVTDSYMAEEARKLLTHVHPDAERATYWRNCQLAEDLAEAADRGDLATVRGLVEGGLHPDSRHRDENTAFELALGGGHVDTAVFLLSQGAEVRPDHIGGVYNSNDPEIAPALFRLLLERGVPPQDLLVSAVQLSPLSAVRLLLEAGADPNLPDPKDEDGGPPLYHAAWDADRVRLLLRHGARVDARNRHGSQAIHFACCWGYTSVVRVLLAGGADPNSVEETEGNIDIPLYYTTNFGHLSTTRLLLAGGADPNFRPHPGATPLMRAARHGCSQTVEALLQAGADPRHKDQEGRTALNYARDWLPDLLGAALARTGSKRWRWFPRKTRERRLVVGGQHWTDGHARIVELLEAREEK